MPKFILPDGTFIEGANFKDARDKQDKAKKAAANAPFRAPVPVPVPAPAPQLVTITPVLTPEDNFANRSQIRFGVGEVIKLGFKTNPIGRTAASLGGLKWFVSRGPGTVKNDPGDIGTGVLTCGDKAGIVVLELRTVVPVAVKVSKRLEIVAPTDAKMVRAPGTKTEHTKGFASAGFIGEIFLLPTDVSFFKTEFREGSAPYEATGCYKRNEVGVADIEKGGGGIRHKIKGKWLQVGKGDRINGSKMVGIDTVRSESLSPPFSAGTFTWNIPWFYRVEDSITEYQFTTATHHEEVDDKGKMTISKKGASASHAADDPTP
jgi:hypothetical protein